MCKFCCSNEWILKTKVLAAKLKFSKQYTMNSNLFDFDSEDKVFGVISSGWLFKVFYLISKQ